MGAKLRRSKGRDTSAAIFALNATIEILNLAKELSVGTRYYRTHTVVNTIGKELWAPVTAPDPFIWKTAAFGFCGVFRT